MSELKTTKKTREDIWMEQEMRDEITELIPRANAVSRSDFVRQAVKFYCGYLRSGKDVNYLAPVVSQTVKQEVRSLERNLSAMLFKLAVENGVQNLILAGEYEVSDELLESLHRQSARTVAETNGVISFEEAYRFQDGGADA